MSAPGVARTALAMALCSALAACGGSFDADEPATVQAQTAAAAAQPSTATAAAAVTREAPPVPPAAARPVPSPTDDLVARIARLEAEVATLKNARGSFAMTVPPPTVQPSATGPTDNPEAAEASFRREETDPAWSRTAAQQVRQAIGQADPVLIQRLQTVECRTRQCRLEFAPGDDATPVETLIPRVITELDSAFVSARTQPMDAGAGRSGTVLFIAR